MSDRDESCQPPLLSGFRPTRVESNQPSRWTRRNFLQQSVSCGAYIAGLAAIAPRQTRAAFVSRQEEEPVTKESWGRIERIEDGVWAMVSTPFEDGNFLTVCNSGIIAGEDRVLIVDAFMDPQGAKWMAEWAERLTGRWPTDVVVTHYHADHTAGAAGFNKDDRAIRVWATQITNERVTESRDDGGGEPPTLENVQRLSAEAVTEIDLGGRIVEVTPRVGHTPSDVSIAIRDPHVVWCGDLFFNQMVPNYMDSIPSELTTSVASLKGDRETIYVPGHGAVADADSFEVYQEFLEAMRTEVKRHFDSGKTPAETATAFALPEPFADWYIFSPQVIPRMVDAWYRDFDADR